jgi:hypothetical protein
MFHLNVLKVDQWRRWLADSGLPHGFGSYLASSSRGAPRPLLSSPLHLATAQWGALPDEATSERTLAEVVAWVADGCVVTPGPRHPLATRGKQSRRRRPDVLALVMPFTDSVPLLS